MRWSYQSSLFIIAVLIAADVAISAPIDVDSDILLEARSPARTRSITSKEAQDFRRITRSMKKPKTQAAAPKKAKPVGNAPKKPKTSGSQLRTGKLRGHSRTVRAATERAGVTFTRQGNIGLIEHKKRVKMAPKKHAGECFMNPKLLRIATENFVIKTISWSCRLRLMPLKLQVIQKSE